MSARQKLNGASLNGCLLLAGGGALLLESWSVFWILLGLFLCIALTSGDIRFRRR